MGQSQSSEAYHGDRGPYLCEAAGLPADDLLNSAMDSASMRATMCSAGQARSRPEVLGNWDIEMPVAALELDMEVLFKHTS